MRRREFITLLGGAATTPLSWQGPALAEEGTMPPAGVLDDDAHKSIERTMAALADVMFPGEGLPSASALGLHLRVAAMPELEALIAAGAAWLDKYAALQGATDFVALSEDKRIAAVDSAFASREAGIQSFVLALRSYLGTAYYSAPAIKSAFAYSGPPQPDGFPDFQERPA
jgi:Gluconate 2-dehydrogenase subunit 3